MENGSRYLVFTDPHETPGRYYVELVEQAIVLGVNEIVCGGDISGINGYMAFARMIDAVNELEEEVTLGANVGNHDYCTAKYTHGKIDHRKVPSKFRHLVDQRLVVEGSPERTAALKTFESMDVAITRPGGLVFRHALARHMVQEGQITDFTVGRYMQPNYPFNPDLLDKNFWTNSDAAKFAIGDTVMTCEQGIKTRVLQHVEGKGGRLLVHGHDHRGTSTTHIDPSSGEMFIRHLPLDQPQKIEATTILQLAPFFSPERPYGVIDVEEEGDITVRLESLAA